MTTKIHQAQKLVQECLADALEQFANSRLPEIRMAEGKRIVREARNLKWTFLELTRMARAIEALETVSPHYE